MDKLQAINLFEQDIAAFRSAIGFYSADIPLGQNKFTDAAANQRGLLLYLSDGASEAQFFGGTGYGDAYQMVSNRFEFDKARTATFNITPYELKHNPQPLCLIGAMIAGLGTCLYANKQPVGDPQSESKYRNPYTVNLKADKKVLFAATLTDKFTSAMVGPLTNSVKRLMLNLGKELPVPQLQQVTQYIVK